MADTRNVIFMLADQLRADSVGCYGNAIVQTPNLDKLAAEGTRFDSAYAQHPQCVPSRSSILTGRYPHANGAISNHCAMNSQEVMLPEFLRSAGWDTCATGKVHLFEDKTNASFAEQMLSQGYICLGKSTLPEFGFNASTEPAQGDPTRNPWNLECTPGGSSGGAAAAAILGMGTLHIGTDGGGSIRIPSSFSGAVGLKPSFGRVPHWPYSAFGTLAHLGPMTRTVADAALMLTVLAEHDVRDGYAVPVIDNSCLSVGQTVQAIEAVLGESHRDLDGMKSNKPAQNVP